jgi:hypothetical protein
VGPLGGKWRLTVGKVGEWYMASRYLQGCSPRLCGLMTDGLPPAGKYWTYRSEAGVYGPCKPSSWLPTDAWLCPHCFIGWLRRETEYGPADQSAGVLWSVSGAVALVNSIDDYAKGCYMWTMWDTYGLLPYADRAWKVCGILVGFSSARCTSIQIAATFGYE